MFEAEAKPESETEGQNFSLETSLDSTPYYLC